MTLEGHLDATPTGAGIQVVLLTSLFNTTAPTDLRAPGTFNGPGITLNDRAAQRSLPSCTGDPNTRISVQTFAMRPNLLAVADFPSDRHLFGAE